jgi:hypothetical protein
LTEIQFDDSARIKIEANVIYYPQSVDNPGWDRILTFEAFPHTGKNSIRRSRKFIIPVFIQNKFCGDDAEITIAVSDVTQSYRHCMRFLEERVGLADGFHFWSKKILGFLTNQDPPGKILFFTGYQKRS